MPYQHIYLSPHFDDVPLSCGGQLAAQVQAGEAVLVVTVCSQLPDPSLPRTPFASELEAQWQVSSGDNATAIYVVRHAEENRALARLGAAHRWLNYLDAIYRRAEYASNEAIFGSIVAADLHEVLPRLTQEVQALAAEIPQADFYVPLALGQHVDHQLTHLAGRTLLGQRQVYFYEDFPYASVPGAIAQRQAAINLPLQAELINIKHTLPDRLASIAEYSSQLDILFGGEAAMRQAVTDYATNVAGGAGAAERYWQASLV